MYNWPNPNNTCSFPRWLTGSTWLYEENPHVTYVTDDFNDTISVYEESSSRSAAATIKCLHIDHFSTFHNFNNANNLDNNIISDKNINLTSNIFFSNSSENISNQNSKLSINNYENWNVKQSISHLATTNTSSTNVRSDHTANKTADPAWLILLAHVINEWLCLFRFEWLYQLLDCSSDNCYDRYCTLEGTGEKLKKCST
ncbi:hypothetical protein HELRODRAFT_166997 [Helobdella robusta]|uniref:Uncharacterized protein n=1 Tax=Helobdella robusta TaxID=6412 RepID=T1EYV1_HELRO|nr:hypothetical protein HELRODRAFT_166997 [Helobdella robusta]ESO11904.1 hypothetical protein HELRODRAFT_166997 [Helobdella robusta]